MSSKVLCTCYFACKARRGYGPPPAFSLPKLQNLELIIYEDYWVGAHASTDLSCEIQSTILCLFNFSYAISGLRYLLLLDEIGQGMLAPSFKPITMHITIPYFLLRTKSSTMLSKISKASKKNQCCHPAALAIKRGLLFLDTRILQL